MFSYRPCQAEPGSVCCRLQLKWHFSYVTPRLCTNFIILQVVRFFQLVCKFLCKFTENYSRNGTNNSRQYCRTYDFRRVHAPILASEGDNIDRDQLQG